MKLKITEPSTLRGTFVNTQIDGTLAIGAAQEFSQQEGERLLRSHELYIGGTQVRVEAV